MSSGHANPTPETPLTLDGTRTPTHAERARTLVAGQRTGALGTLTAEGFPYSSYVTFALYEGDPVLLMSSMAEHTKNLERDSRSSLLVHESGANDPLANGRVTLVGHGRRLADPGPAREAFLAAHPQASYYADFKDFAFYSVRVESVRYIGGYGRMSWVGVEDWRAAETDPIAPHAAGILAHMNEDHADALVAYARAFTRATEAKDVVMTGIDRYGFELSVAVEGGRRPARVAFVEPIATSEQARERLVAMVREARTRLG